jgi:signal transduction histidine kinase
MPTADDAPDGFVYDATDQLRHDLKSPLTTIYARAYLLGRAIRRSPSLNDEERTQMLAGVAAIESAVRETVIVVDGIPLLSSDGRTDPTGMGR